MKNKKDEHLSLPKTATTPPPPQRAPWNVKKVCYGRNLTYTTRLPNKTTENTMGDQKDEHLSLPKTTTTPFPGDPMKVQETKRLLWQTFNLYY